MTRRVAIVFLAALAVAPARSDEGMWTFESFPSSAVGEKYGFAPTADWLDRVRLASARLADGCSAGFVSADGLVMTNYHCVGRCIESLSAGSKRLDETGVITRSPSEEQRCPGFEVNQLLETRDVTPIVSAATRGIEGEAYSKAMREVSARLERECQSAPDLRCDLVSLYRGGLYRIYRYRRWQDVRLVFAPERAAAFFGGDPDNFMFPRYDLDVAFLRVYEGGKPARTEHFFRWSPSGAKEGDLVFVPGNPGRSERLDTVAELETERDEALPDQLLDLAELRGILTEFGRRGEEPKREAADTLLAVENTLKVLRGRQRALNDPVLFARKTREEDDLRRRVEADPVLAADARGAWDAIAGAERRYRDVATSYRLLEGRGGIRSALFSHARTLVRAADELAKPDGERLPSFTTSRLSRTEQLLLAPRAIHRDLEIATLTYSLGKLREELGVDDPVVKRVLGRRSPSEIAVEAVSGTRLDDPDVRHALLDGGAKAVAESKDPMIALARVIDPDARAVRSRVEDDIEAVVRRSRERIARARFAVYGTALYPDATFTLRLSYGQVKGWVERGVPVPAFTSFRGLFDRYTGREPFDLPRSWLDARGGLGPDHPLNLVSDNDIIGGNSGSPMIDREARIVGLVFDGNIHSLGGDFWFDEATNRTVAVDGRAILEALDEVYHATGLARELRAGGSR